MSGAISAAGSVIVGSTTGAAVGSTGATTGATST